MVTKGESQGGGMKWETETDIYTLLSIKQMIGTYFVAQGSRLDTLE